MPDRGVSEVLGFVLVFSLIVATVGVVYVVGFGGLADVRDAERLRNAERAFDVLADNLNDITRGNAPNRATEIKLSEARLHLSSGPQLKVTITSGTPGTPSYKRNFDPIVYTAEGSDTKLVYTSGAVVRVDDDSAVLKRRPPMVFREAGTTRVAIIPIIQTRSTTTQHVSGDGTVLVRADQASAVVLNTDNTSASGYTVNVTVGSTAARAPVWERHLDGRIEDAYGVSDPCRLSSPAVAACEFDVDRLYVTATYVDVEFSG